MTPFEKSLNKQGIIVRDPSMVKIYSDAFHIASTNANVLIIGDSGTGKVSLQSTSTKTAPEQVDHLSM